MNNIIGNIFRIAVDLITGAAIAIDYAHHEIHDGRSFRVDHSSLALDITEKISISFKTPASGPQIHMDMLGQSTGGSTIELLESPSISTDGIEVNAINKDFNSSNISDVISIAASPTVGKVSLDAATITGGVSKQKEVLGKGNIISGENRSLGENVLKYNTEYSAILTSNIANNVCQLTLVWYEHTPKK